MNEDEATQQDGLRDIARWLTTPAACGLFLSARDLERVGRRAGVEGLPRSRRQAVEHLFRTAALDDRVDILIDLLIDEAGFHMDSYAECGMSTLGPWESAAVATVGRLNEMKLELAD